MKPSRVLIVDDSALMRKVLSDILDRDPALEVVGTAADPLLARSKIRSLNPDVLTLDIEMPKMDGLTFLRNLMRLRPMPVVMVSSLTEKAADVTFEALSLGAVDFVTKPKVNAKSGLEEQAEDIVTKVKAAARARLQPRSDGRPAIRNVPPKHSTDAILQRSGPPRVYGSHERVIAVGASTGGTEAITDILLPLPVECPIIVATQHIPPTFSASFARRLDAVCGISVVEAEDGMVLKPGTAYIAPGDAHLLVVRDGRQYKSQLSRGPAVNRHRPSVDVLFRSVAQAAGKQAVGVLLTGMGDDGARGLLELREAGAHTIAQDEDTSVVWGMPGEAVKLNAAREVLPLDQVSARMVSVRAPTAA